MVMSSTLDSAMEVEKNMQESCDLRWSYQHLEVALFTAGMRSLKSTLHFVSVQKGMDRR